MTTHSIANALVDRMLAAFRFMLLLAMFMMFALAAAEGDFLKVGALVGGVVFAVILAYGRWWLLLAWITATPTVLILVNNFMVHLPVINGPRLLFAALAAVAGATVLLRRGRVAPITLTEGLMLVMVPFMVISAMLSLDCAGGDPVDEAKLSFALLLDGFVMPYFAFWIARQVAWTDARVRLLLILLMVMGVYIMTAGSLQYFLGINALSPDYVTEIHLGRARGPFPNAAEFGSVMMVLAVLAFYFVFEARDILGRLTATALGALFLFGVGLSLTRSVWISMPIAALWLVIADRRTRPYLLPVMVVGGLVGLALLPFIMQIGPVADRLNDVTPVYNRMTLYMTALSMGWDNPLTGVGFGRYCFMANSIHYAQPFLGIPAQYIVGVG
ncbi:MAG: O-antigen ligase family protein, partial [Rhodospirillaceae bacterium]